LLWRARALEFFDMDASLWGVHHRGDRAVAPGDIELHECIYRHMLI